MSIYDDISNEGSLAKGDHLAKLDNVEIKVSKGGNEYINLKFKLKSGEVLWHNLFFSEKALPMAIRQLKSLKLIASLPIYSSTQDLLNDGANFMRKVESLLTQLDGKKVMMSCTGHDDSGRPKLWIKEYADVENAAIQKANPESKKADSGFNDKEEIPF